ncbi:MAG: accessory gene regulator B family protein [Lachnospiraceae bacterium]|nr:accessory gene regulator B family protein [Lachnospiraceae bacterium]
MEAVLDKIQLEYNLSDRQRKLLQFSFIGLIYDITKLVLLFIFFACIHQITAFIFNVFLLMVLRINQGGLHLKHYTTCFIFSFLYLFLSICVLPMLIPEVPQPLGLCIIFLCMLINYIAGPQKNIKIYTELKNPENVLKSKMNSSVVCTLYMIAFFVFPNAVLMQQGMWMIVLHTMQIVIVIIKKLRKEKKDD